MDGSILRITQKSVSVLSATPSFYVIPDVNRMEKCSVTNEEIIVGLREMASALVKNDGIHDKEIDILLRAAEIVESGVPRVMTLDEVKEASSHDLWSMWNGCVWLEGICGNLAPIFMDITYEGQLRVFSQFMHDYKTVSPCSETWWHFTYYGKTWRLWTAKPSFEDMKAAKWGDAE